MMLNPGLAEAYAAKGRLLWNKTNVDKSLIDEALTYYERAIQINPSYAEAYVVMAKIYALQPTRHREHIAALEKAVNLDPLSRSANSDYIFTLIFSNRLVEADQQIERFASIDPADAMILRGFRSSIGGNWAHLILAYLEAVNNAPGTLVFDRWASFAFCVASRSDRT